ncbi:hypothetical protein BDW74DRAFT_75443 [Aspergillus multicolor]|uniref:fungal specific transcription factor domain-containing protein n=1 Tax=Aspergillus multicolor TaxID=41759 RepID=UPI003CCE2EC3
MFNPGLPLEGSPRSRILAQDTPELLRNPRLTGAYGYSGLSDDYTNSQNINEPPIPSDSLLLFQPSTQAQLLEEFWNWQNTWPFLVHQPLFEKDLAGYGANGYFSTAVLSAMLSLSAQYCDEDHSSSWKTSADSLAQHVKRLVLGQIERPSLSLALAAALVSLRDLTVGNLASASQYIGIACRHAMLLGLHLESSDHSSDSNDLKEARTLMWLGIWMLEKHITQILGQPGPIRECDKHPFSVPINPSIEYRPWPTSDSSLALTSHCMSNMQYACDLIRMVSPVISEIYELTGHSTLQAKEEKATKTHVTMSVFYNNLPSPLRLPATSTTPLPPHVYQLNLQYHTLKIMLHHPFINEVPSMKALQDSQNAQMVHIQSATFSAIRIGQIINAYRNFYPVHRLSPFTVQSLVVASLIHLYNANSTDTALAQRSRHLHGLNHQTLHQMAPMTRCSAPAIEFLDSVQHCGVLGANKSSGSQYGSSSNLPAVGPGLATFVPDNMNMDLTMDLFDWFELPLHNELLFDGDYADLLSSENCEIEQTQCWSVGDDIAATITAPSL